MLTQFSSDPEVSAAVARLVVHMHDNPYDWDARAQTMEAVVDVIELAMGRRAARSIKFTIH